MPIFLFIKKLEHYNIIKKYYAKMRTCLRYLISVNIFHMEIEVLFLKKRLIRQLQSAISKKQSFQYLFFYMP